MKPNDERGVSMFVKATIAVSLVGAAVLIWYLRRGHEEAPAVAAPAPTSATAAAPADAAKPRPNDRVRKVTPAERNEVARQIAEARKGRAATSAPAGPSLPTTAPSLPATLSPGLDPNNVDSFKSTFRGAMKEVVPYLAECFDKHAAELPDKIDVMAKLSLHGDPDVGTLIDTDGLTDGNDGPLLPGFDICVRDALAGLALPPLAEGEEVRVNYPFVFTR